MGKSLNLGKKLRYPITVTKLLKTPGEAIRKEEPIFQYTFTWYREVGDPFGEQWQEKQVTPADWDSPVDGKITKWAIGEGMIVDKDTACAEIEESCEHNVQFAGLCVVCGKDMNETSWASDSKDADRARINMIHDQTLLSVSQTEASRAEEQLQRRLLENRKLSLVVDLDQTIIHACIEPTIGEWQQDMNSPNHEAVKDVKKFQLADDGPRGLASGCWYYIKMRPGLKEFLAHVAEIYELHVYTMGTRAYAQNIATIVDPDHKLFGDRIISRDENGSLTAKTLSRLFPVDTKMVVIIDDRADVWPKNRPNLIKVVPYDFFVGIGDINSSFLPKREEVPKSPTAAETQQPGKVETDNASQADPLTARASPAVQELNTRSNGLPLDESNDRLSALEGLVSMGGSSDPSVRQIQVEEQEEFLEKQLKERPLLHMQQELEKEEGTTEVTNGDGEATSESSQERHHLLNDDDVELVYLESHLTNLHKAFYGEYDRARINAQGGRAAHLRPGAKKKISMKDEAADLQIVPDIGEVMPRLKARTLASTVIVLSGLVPLGADVMRSELVQQAISFGADVQTRVSKRVTHVVVSANRTRTQKVRQAAKYPHIKIVNQQWLMSSMSKWRMEDELPYLIEIHREEKSPTDDDSGLCSPQSDENSIGGDTDGEDDETRGRGETQDPEDLVPDEEATSPIDGLKRFDWDSADQELAEFMASGDEDDGGEESDADSVTSRSTDRSQASHVSIRTKDNKRKPDDSDGDETDGESHVAKKKRLALARSTSLKTVKTPNSVQSESSIPTPDVTGGEEGEADNVDYTAILSTDHEADDLDLEAEMMAEFEKDDWNQDEDSDSGPETAANDREAT
ncbi:MAG: Carboxy-terminal domain (CTD) phosphatase [Claussenomyces sp. TS43310]|nr:MAG: Carboxy-terminal domain (CTD) phosphatase [Claussenomyces sp. TS43310]